MSQHPTDFSPQRLLKAVIFAYVGMLAFGFVFAGMIGESVPMEGFYLLVPIMLAFEFPLAALVVVFLSYCCVGVYEESKQKKRSG